jgi:hypothetical protein
VGRQVERGEQADNAATDDDHVGLGGHGDFR